MENIAPDIMPQYLPSLIDWIYMNGYEQIDFGKWKRWYTDETIEYYENEANPNMEIDHTIYSTEDLYTQCVNDIGYWEHLGLDH